MTVSYKAKTLTIDERCEILAGLRMEVTNASVSRYGFHRSAELKVRARKLEWAASEANPEGKDRWAADLDIADDGEIRIPSDAIGPYFHDKDPKDSAHLMLNIFCDMPKGDGYFASLGFFKKPEIYTFDSVVPQDENGRWTYSRPIHLNEAGKESFFFFLALKSTGGPNVELRVHKIKIVRGKEHYRITRTPHYMRVADLNQLAGIAQKTPEVRDLPIAKLVEAYQGWNQ